MECLGSKIQTEIQTKKIFLNGSIRFTSNDEINLFNKTTYKITNEINLLITNQIESLNLLEVTLMDGGIRFTKRWQLL